MHALLLWGSAALWIAFIIYWSTTAGGTPKTETATSTPTEDKPTGDAPAGEAPQRRPWISFRFKRASAPLAGTPGVVSSESPKSRQTHQLLLWGALLLAFLPGIPPLDRPWLPDPSNIHALGLLGQGLCALLYIWSKRHLGRNWSGPIMTKTDHTLVRTGPYRWLRHPMYTAILGMFLGTAFVSGEWHALAALGVATFAYWRKTRLEERHMERSFGAEYESYREGSWALIPGIV